MFSIYGKLNSKILYLKPLNLKFKSNEKKNFIHPKGHLFVDSAISGNKWMHKYGR